MKSSRQKIISVSPAEAGGWKVVKDDVVALFTEQDEAIVVACELAHGTEYNVHIFNDAGKLTTVMNGAPPGSTASGFYVALM